MSILQSRWIDKYQTLTALSSSSCSATAWPTTPPSPNKSTSTTTATHSPPSPPSSSAHTIPSSSLFSALSTARSSWRTGWRWVRGGSCAISDDVTCWYATSTSLSTHPTLLYRYWLSFWYGWGVRVGSGGGRWVRVRRSTWQSVCTNRWI